jgi:hypothetical protein
MNVRSELAQHYWVLHGLPGRPSILAQGSPHGFFRHHKNPVIYGLLRASVVINRARPWYFRFKGHERDDSVFNYRGSGVLLVN